MPLSPDIAAIADAMASSPDARPTHELPPDEARVGYTALGSMFGPGEDVAAVADRTLPGPAAAIPIRIYSPHAAGPHPVLVFYHGGGWVIGDLDSHDKECRALCNGASCLVVSVDYRLAPEHPFPAAPDDAFAALEWVVENAASLGGDSERIAVAGDSAGGNLAAVVSLLARDSGGPSLRFQLLIYPAVDSRPGDLYPSQRENAAGPFLLAETMTYFRSHYFQGAAEERSDVRASPILATSHAGLPPALIVTAGYDPLRDEGAAYAGKLEEAGVAVELRCYEGMPHVFYQLSPVIADGKHALALSCEVLRRAFA